MKKIKIKSIINKGDSYKYSHPAQNRPNLVSAYNYIESRGGLYPATVWIGMQATIQENLMIPVTMKEVKYIRARCEKHGVPFDYKGWKRIVKVHNGFLPVRIKSIPEGSLVPTNHVLATFESTDPKLPWIPGFIETVFMRLWYPTTVATKSHAIRQTLLKYGSPDWAQFALHHFGARGQHHDADSQIGGFAHATQFLGSDNFSAMDHAEQFYNQSPDMPITFSVFATEHSTTTSYGKDNEEQFVYDMLIKHPDAPIMSFVADSYDVYNFTNFCTAPNSRIRKLIESRPHQKFVLRPDSGSPIEVLDGMIDIMFENDISSTGNQEEETLTFSDFGILWGDGITHETIEKILKHNLDNGFAAENFVFGMGGGLATVDIHRDTQRFAIKCSSITVHTLEAHRVTDVVTSAQTIGTRDIDVFKDPITDPGKASKRGKVTTWYDTEAKQYIAGKLNEQPNTHCVEALELVYENGKQFNLTTMNDIRKLTI